MIDKGICDKCECYKSYDVGEYLDYKNCKCRKRLTDKLFEECSESIDENEMNYNNTLNDYKNVCGFCTIHIVLFSMFLTISISIATVFVHFYWYTKNEVVTNINPGTENNNLLDKKMGNIKQISIENRTHYFFNDMISIKDFDSNLLKTDKKLYKNIDVSLQ